MKFDPSKCWLYEDMPTDRRELLDDFAQAVSSGDESKSDELLEKIMEDWMGCYYSSLEQVHKLIKLEELVKTKTQRNKLLRPGQAAEKFMEVLRGER
ncbi:MAG: hypothetical protein J7524_10625 [Roseofilum sp. Belize BBD 4]|uniref:hypothetical protein n=1 Tax=Roseofilum sp. Belize BBD 4 TaxID=2821500 RepID=UPI001B25AD5F|nr:hypothetical protein [Roseofilum sp. Belize BBD 4]MBP0033607.1 hypothetical protein [Roseofilum sp. Belize BBD 4]